MFTAAVVVVTPSPPPTTTTEKKSWSIKRLKSMLVSDRSGTPEFDNKFHEVLLRLVLS